MKYTKRIMAGLLSVILGASTIATPVYAATTKPTLQATPNHKENYISLNWDINDKSEPYRYQLYQVREGEEEANSIQAKDSVKVLNIYPEFNRIDPHQPVTNKGLSEGQVDLEGKPVLDSGILKTWLLKENIDEVEIETIGLSDFNKNPSKYLKKENGLWNYDSVFYGMWNLQPEQVYPNNQAIEHLRTFIHDGGGFMTSHHTMGYKGLDRGVNKLADEMGVEIFSNQPVDWPHKEYIGQNPDGTLFPTVSFIVPDGSPRDQSSYWPRGKKVEIVKKGFLTEYPFEVGEIGQAYDIPDQHGLNVFAKGDVWMETVNPKGYSNQTFREITTSPATGEKGTNNFYVHTYNNTAIINSGHSFPNITQAETRIIANTLYYLSQITTNTSWDDRSGQDLTAPQSPDVQSVKYNKQSGKLDFSWKNVKDLGSTYKYYVKATALNDGSEYNSDMKEATITSGLKGYSIVADTKPDTVPDKTIETTGTSYSLTKEFNQDFYIHVGAVDNRDNMSVEHYFVDITAPTGETMNNPTEWTGNSVTFKVYGYDEGGSGIDTIMSPKGVISKGNIYTYTVAQNGSYDFVIRDKAGNQTVHTVVVDKIDTTNPQLTLKKSTEEWTNKAVEVTATGTDNQSGILSVKLSQDYEDTNLVAMGDLMNWNSNVFKKEGNQIQIRPRLTTTHGQTGGFYIPHDLFEQGKDYVLSFDMTKVSGDISIIGGHHYISSDAEVYIDGKRMGSAYETDKFNDWSNGVWYPNDNKTHHITVKFNIDKKDGHSDKNIYVQLNRSRYGDKDYEAVFENIQLEKGIEETPYTPNSKDLLSKKNPLIVPLGKNGTYEFVATDNVGNETRKSIKIDNIDSEKPTLDIDYPTELTNRDVAITLHPSDTGGSGLKEVELPNGDIVNSFLFDIRYDVSQNGSYDFIVRDVAGNEMKYTVNITKIDKVTNPLVVTASTTKWTKEPIVLTAQGLSFVENIILPDGNMISGNQAQYTIHENGHYIFTGVDKNGYQVVTTYVVSNIDKEGKRVLIVPGDDKWRNKDIQVHIEIPN